MSEHVSEEENAAFEHSQELIRCQDSAYLATHQTECNLRERESKLSKIMESIIDPMITIDPSGVIQEASLSSMEVFGWDARELIGKNLLVLIPDEMHPAYSNLLAIIQQNGELPLHKKVHETSLKRMDGTLVPCEVVVWKTVIPGQILPYYTGIIRDISRRIQAEQEHQKTYNRLLETTRKAGMAEIATGVLHNVGNVLNSVNVSVNSLQDLIRNSQISGLEKATEMIAQNRDNLGEFFEKDRKGIMLIDFLCKLSVQLKQEKSTLLQELRELSSNVDHIKEIVTTQQAHAKVSGTTEIIEVVEVVESAIKTIDASLAKHGMRLFREYQDIPSIISDKHKILQILVNLIGNAKHAIADSYNENGEIRITLSAPTDSNVRIDVEDNGVGIVEENMSKIFRHGFTTKESGHGFGLHSCSLVAKELGGSLTAFSAGHGKGARFTLTLPVIKEGELVCQ
ncbi:MAG: PAS domain S-box protein [Planctomycetaceae bacterium]|nr:PAS domain S-box protein [Planctomycetaceae bacterium]